MVKRVLWQVYKSDFIRTCWTQIDRSSVAIVLSQFIVLVKNKESGMVNFVIEFQVNKHLTLIFI